MERVWQKWVVLGVVTTAQMNVLAFGPVVPNIAVWHTFGDWEYDTITNTLPSNYY